MAKQSYSYKTKHALLAVPPGTPGTLRAELAALLATCGAIRLSRAGLSVEFVSENPDLCERVDMVLGRLYGRAVVPEDPYRRFDKEFFPFVVPESVAGRVLADCGITEGDELRIASGIPASLVDSLDDREAYIRGAFLGGGVLNFGDSGYLLEFHFLRECMAEDFLTLLNEIDVDAHIVERNNRFVVYLKDRQEICDVLAHIGATKAVMDIQVFRAEREVKERMSRECNCITFNLNRTAVAASARLADIALIRARVGLDALDGKLRETAEAREANPEDSLAALADKLGLTKSCLKHRLAKIGEIADELRETGEDTGV